MADQNQHQTLNIRTVPHERGDKVYTDHGPGVVVGYENRNHIGVWVSDTLWTEHYRVAVHLDTPTPWADGIRVPAYPHTRFYRPRELHAKPAFVLPDSSGMATPFEGLHFWQWLSELPEQDAQALHGVETKRKYLTGLGFVVGDDWLTEDDMRLLRYTMNHYFTSVVRPALYAAHVAKLAGGQGGDV